MDLLHEHGLRTVVLVEGASDRIAVEALARRTGRDLDARGATVVSSGGVQGLGRTIAMVRERHPDAGFAGLYDTAEEHVVRRALAVHGLADPDDDPAEAGFFACTLDLEDELIRACRADLVRACLREHGDLGAFERLRAQPQWRDRPVEAQLRRWLGSGARRKLRYAEILLAAMPEERMPRPLLAVLARAVQE